MNKQENIEEAIKYFEDMKKGVFPVNGNWLFDMAIESLKQEPKILETLDFAIDASNGDTNYFVGFRNGLRYAKSLIDGEEEPPFESCNESLSILDCAKKIKEHCTNAKWCFDCELGNGDGTCKLADNEYCYLLPNEWKL